MPNSRRINLSTAKSSSNTPLIFISHDTRDKDLASEFKKLIHAVSSGLWSSFQSSDQGIEYGSEWYPTILKSLKSASHVVCLLTERSVNRPWILYEAGIAKGEAGIAKSKSGKPVIVIAIGIPLSQASTGPFAQFQNLFVAGGEAQWCLFDPILSIYYGLRFRRTHDALEFLKQTEYLNRSLGQITGANGRYGEFQCPELYYLEKGQRQTSRSTPLLWTQANLSIALKIMEENLHL